MKYRHTFHAGNFADVHKHVTLLALLSSLKRKEKGFAYFETHGGRGAYDLSHPSQEALDGIGRFAASAPRAEELREYARVIENFRASRRHPHAYPGSPLIAAEQLRAQDRAVFSEILAPEARLLERQIGVYGRARVERGDGFERLRAWLPPTERRGLVFIDPPYEESRQDFDRVTRAVAEGLQRFSTGVFAVWYPIKDARETHVWRQSFRHEVVATEALVSELWLYPRDSQVALNGSGLLIVNPPYLMAERMEVWLPELYAVLSVGHAGGTSVTNLRQTT